MLGWFIGQAIETGITGLVVGAGLAADRLRNILIGVLLFSIAAFVIGILLQNI
jgi:hypothetical protein